MTLAIIGTNILKLCFAIISKKVNISNLSGSNVSFLEENDSHVLPFKLFQRVSNPAAFVFYEL